MIIAVGVSLEGNNEDEEEGENSHCESTFISETHLEKTCGAIKGSVPTLVKSFVVELNVIFSIVLKVDVADETKTFPVEVSSVIAEGPFTI